MTKQPSIKTEDLDEFAQLNLHQLETKLKELQQNPPSRDAKAAQRAARQALRQRQRYLKAKAMEFEETNDHHLLLFDSTDNFSKIAGHSVLFYSLIIADRLHRRFSVKNDSDDYSRSSDGIISVRSLSQLELQLAEVNIFPDRKLSTPELHFYKLPRTYSEEQIAKLRDRSRQDVERITSIIMPKSPVPELYNSILEMNRLVYHNCKKISDSLARATLVEGIILDANEILVSYLNYANARPTAGIIRRQLQNISISTAADQKSQSAQAQNLFNILIYTRNIRNNMANIENLKLMHHRELCGILEKLVEIERVTAREYAKQLKLEKKSETEVKTRTRSKSTPSTK